MNVHTHLFTRSEKKSLQLWLTMLLLSFSASAQSPSPKMIVWVPGMDHCYQDGVLWLKADAPAHSVLAVSVSADVQFISVQISVANRSPAGIDVLPDRFSMTLNQPQAMAPANVPSEHAPGGALRATTVKPGEELHGTVYFRQERVCARGGCQGLLTVPTGETVYVFPVTLESRTSSPIAPGASTPASRYPVTPRPTAANPAPIPATPAAGPVTSVSRPPSAQVVRTGRQRDWKMGKVLDYEKSRNVFTTGSTTSAETNGSISPNYGGGASVHAEITATTTVHHAVVKTTDLFIVGDQYVYEVEDSVRRGDGGGLMGVAVQAVINRKHGCRFIVGEEIKYAQEKGQLYVIDPDGKECKAEILRQEKR